MCRPSARWDGADQVRAINTLGLRRAKFCEDDIKAIDQACRAFFSNRKQPFELTLAEYQSAEQLNPHVKELVDFLVRRNAGKKGAIWKRNVRRRNCPRPFRPRSRARTVTPAAEPTPRPTIPNTFVLESGLNCHPHVSRGAWRRCSVSSTSPNRPRLSVAEKNNMHRPINIIDH
jgi:hypothetical protein